jgi:hypothetical protein
MSDLSERICIIGGGPAGISAAMYLQIKGYQNYTIYEKNKRVGGKCYSPHIRFNGEERTYETGAIMGAITYHAVHEVEKFAGTGHSDGPNMRRMYRDAKGKEIFPFDPKKDFSPKKLKDLLRLKKQMKRLVEIMETKYKGYDCYGHRGIADGRYAGLSKGVANSLEMIEGENPNLKDLALPFSEFCKLNGVEDVMKIWLGPYTSFGYGFFDEIPAAYVMKYLDTTTAIEFINMRLWTWKEGTQSIYAKANERLVHPAELNTEVVKIRRTAGENGKVFVTVRNAEGEREEAFDKLIVTTPLDHFAGYTDASDEEKELFGKIIHEKYVNFIATFAKNEGPTISGYIFDNMVPERLGHAMVYYHRWEDLGANCPCSVYALRNHQGDKDADYNYTINAMQDDMRLCGYPVKERHYEQETYYCPHVSPEDYAAGWYDRLEEMQGKNRTYYAGEILSFGDMEDTCASSRDIVGRFF